MGKENIGAYGTKGRLLSRCVARCNNILFRSGWRRNTSESQAGRQMNDFENILYQGKQFAEFIKCAGEKEILDFMMELRESMTKLRDENRVLKARIEQCEVTEPVVAKAVQYGKYVYPADDPDHHRPCCLNCWAFERKLVPLTIYDNGAGVVVKCQTCNRSAG